MGDEGETYEEQVNRLRAMAADDCGAKWDLSDNDRAAISAVLARAGELESAVARARDVLRVDRHDTASPAMRVAAALDALDDEGR